MKRSVIPIAIAFGVALSLCAFAQSPAPSPSADSSPAPSCERDGHKGGGILAHLTNELGLSGTQQAQVAAILQQAKPQMKAIQEEAQAKRKALVNSVSSQISPLLTPDQQTKLTAMVQKLEARQAEGPMGFHKGGPGGKGGLGGKAPFVAQPGAVLDRLTSELGLSTAQQAQLKPLLDSTHTQVLSIRNDTTLTPVQKFAKIKETLQTTRTQIASVLTPAQQQQLQAMKAKWRDHGPRGGAPSASPSPSATGTNL